MGKIDNLEEITLTALKCCAEDPIACNEECPMLGNGCLQKMAQSAIDLVERKNRYISYLQRKLDKTKETYRTEF